MKNTEKNEECLLTRISIDSPNVLTVKSDIYKGQNLLLVQHNKMRVVVVQEIRRLTNSIQLKVKDENKGIISLNLNLYDKNFVTPFDWIIVSIPYIVERVMDKL